MALKLRVLWQCATVVWDINTRVGTFCFTYVLIVKLKSRGEMCFICSSFMGFIIAMQASFQLTFLIYR